MLDGLIDSIKGYIQSFIEYVFFGIFWLIEAFFCRFIDAMEDMMNIFTGEKDIIYNDNPSSLINVFFFHDSIRGIYGAIGMIGIVFAFIFAIVAVIRRVLDLRGKQQGVTLGSILGNLFKSILLIFSMNAIMLVTITASNVLIQQVSYAVTHGNEYAKGPSTKTFDDQEFAAMGRIINTIGNYSINPSYRSRYNLNACYNAIREDLQYLGSRGMFDYHYVSYDAKNNIEPTWQSVIEELAVSYDYNYEAPLDSYNDGLTNDMLDAMELFKKNQNVRVLKSFTREEIEFTGNVPMSRVLFLAGTMGTIGNRAAARNAIYNKHPSFNDPVRYPFYIGEKNIFDYDDVRETFNPSPAYTNYVVVYIGGLGILMEMIVIIMTCAVRIFNLVTLYVSAPLVIAAMPLDDGGKFKQWTTAFIVQLLGIVGMIIAMKLFLMFLPIIWSPDLKIAEDVILDVLVRLILMYAALEAVNRINGVFTGILADNAGYQAITAGNMRDSFQNSGLGKRFSQLTGQKAMKETGDPDKGGGGGGGGGGDKKDDVDEHKKKLQNDRAAKNLKSDIDHAEKTGHHRAAFGGKKLQEGELMKMKFQYNHMKEGKSEGDAKKMAELDYKDHQAGIKEDAKMDAMDRLHPTKTPPPSRGGEGGDLPKNQRNQPTE